MTIFAKLPADARRALARAELRRRGLPLNPERPNDFDAILPQVSLADLRHMEAWLPGAEVGDEQQLQLLLRTQQRMLQSRQANLAQEPDPPARYVPDLNLQTTEERAAHQQRYFESIKDARQQRESRPESDAALAAVGRLIVEFEAVTRSHTFATLGCQGGDVRLLSILSVPTGDSVVRRRAPLCTAPAIDH